jgi:hypothetical protein
MMNHVQAIYRKYGMRLHRKIFDTPEEAEACVRELSECATLRPSPYDLRLDDPAGTNADQTDVQS